MATATIFDRYTEDVAEKVHNLQSDTFKLLLSNTLPVASAGLKANWTEIAAGNGYSAGGIALTVSSSAQTAGAYKQIIADAVLTAAGGSIAAWRYAILYNDTPASPADPGIEWWDYGSSVTLADTESMTFDFDGTAGALQMNKV